MSPQSEQPVSTVSDIAVYSPEERKDLLHLARRAIGAHLAKQKLDLTPPSAHLGEPRGVFTTLHLRGELRGCVGYVAPIHSVWRTVAETAVAAGFSDPRFAPLSAEEVPDLKIDLSVLSPLTPIRAEEVAVGRHGLMISLMGRRGLLLPQVATEHNWDREEFLRQTCCKAGLPPNAWQEGAQVEAFTAEVFGETARDQE